MTFCGRKAVSHNRNADNQEAQALALPFFLAFPAHKVFLLRDSIMLLWQKLCLESPLPKESSAGSATK